MAEQNKQPLVKDEAYWEEQYQIALKHYKNEEFARMMVDVIRADYEEEMQRQKREIPKLES